MLIKCGSRESRRDGSAALCVFEGATELRRDGWHAQVWRGCVCALGPNRWANQAGVVLTLLPSLDSGTGGDVGFKQALTNFPAEDRRLKYPWVCAARADPPNCETRCEVESSERARGAGLAGRSGEKRLGGTGDGVDAARLGRGTPHALCLSGSASLDGMWDSLEIR